MEISGEAMIVLVIVVGAGLTYLVTMLTSPGSGVLKKGKKRVNVFDSSYQHMEVFKSYSSNINRQRREKLDIKYSEHPGTPTNNLPQDGYGKYKDQ